MRRLDLGEVLLWQSGADIEIGLFGQKAEIGEGIDLGLLQIPFVKPGFGKDMVNFEPVHFAEQIGLER
jgi:hypothetical protein